MSSADFQNRRSRYTKEVCFQGQLLESVKLQIPTKQVTAEKPARQVVSQALALADTLKERRDGDNFIPKIVGIPRCIYSLYFTVSVHIQKGGMNRGAFSMKTKPIFRIIYETHQHHLWRHT